MGHFFSSNVKETNTAADDNSAAQDKLLNKELAE